jgi:hypothetical protein
MRKTNWNSCCRGRVTSSQYCSNPFSSRNTHRHPFGIQKHLAALVPCGHQLRWKQPNFSEDVWRKFHCASGSLTQK